MIADPIALTGTACTAIRQLSFMDGKKSVRRVTSGWQIGCAVVWLLVIATPAAAEPIGFMERFALAGDREAVLDELIPGSDDAYFYRVLYHQTEGELEQAEAVLAEWLRAHNGRPTTAIREMTDRQRLLTYDQSPGRTVDYLINRLGVQLHHAPPPTPGERRYPSELPKNLLSVDRLVREAVQRGEKLSPAALIYLGQQFLSEESTNLPLKLEDFLQRVGSPLMDGLDRLVIQELKSRRPNRKRFGDRNAHQFLTLDQLRKVASQVPEVADDQAMVDAILLRLRPGADSDIAHQPDVRLAYLQRVEAYTRSLPPSYNSLKASAAYRLLEANLSHGIFDQELLIRYLELPRSSPVVHPIILRLGNRANLRQDFTSNALLPPIPSDEPVVRAHLEHFLRDASSPDAFDRLVPPDYLDRVFAETKLLAGVGDQSDWYKLLSAGQRQTLRDRVEVRLAPTNPTYCDPSEPASLVVDVKHVDQLIARVYQINTSAYLRTNEDQLDTDLDLDGLVATFQQEEDFNQPAIRRHRETLTFPEISGRGVWMVDLIGGGVRARALIRRGYLDYVSHPVADGLEMTVIDESRNPVAEAKLWIGSREFVADNQGRVVLPPTATSTSRKAIFSDGEIASRVDLRQRNEQYALTAGMYIDRAQLQSGGKASLVIRPRLTMSGVAIDPQTLSEVQVRIDTKDLDDIATTTQVNDAPMEQTGETVVAFRVPPRLKEMTVTLTGKVDRLSDQQQQTLQTSQRWEIAGIRSTTHTRDAFLTRDGRDYVVEVRGRNGEPVPGAAVIVAVTTKYRQSPATQTLQSDDSGRVRLGPLSDATEVQFSTGPGPRHRVDLRMNRVTWPDHIQTSTGEMIRIPVVEGPRRDGADQDELPYRLLAVDDGAVREDFTKRITQTEGFLEIEGLPAGDYQLSDRTDGRTIRLAIVNGPAISGVLAGKVRHRSIVTPAGWSIASVDRKGGGLKIRLAGQPGQARVHVFASRYLDPLDPAAQLALPFPEVTGRSTWPPQCGYVSDRRLGDEYQYVLRRQMMPKYPGVMLPQPGVILNPWATDETSNTSQSVAEDEQMPSTASEPQSDMDRLREAKNRRSEQSLGSDFDFLDDPGVVLTNLRPDEQGVVTVPAEALEGLPVIRIVACDELSVFSRLEGAPLKDVPTVDLRLAKTLDRSSAWSMRRQLIVAGPNDPLDLDSLGSAQVQVYGTVASLFKLYQTFVGDPRFMEFESIAKWHEMDRDEKLDAYSRVACHELHLFVYFHDRPFFDEVVAPYLANKKEKQFVDDWLLENDLTPYTDVWSYNQLNAAELALMALRMPELRSTIERELRERVAEQQEDPARRRLKIDSALRLGISASGLDDFDGIGDRPANELLENNFRGLKSQSGARSELDQLGLSRESGMLDGEFSRERSARRNAPMSAPMRPGMTSDRTEEAKRFDGLSRRKEKRKQLAFYRELDRTRQWAESQWDRSRTVGGPSPSQRIPVGPFWSNLAQLADQGDWKGESDPLSVSEHLLQPTESRHAALVALATCGLPLAAGEIALPSESSTPYQPSHRVAVVTKRLGELEAGDGEGDILIGQRFVDPNRRSEKTGSPAEVVEFIAGVAYQGQIVLSNPTAETRAVNVLWQLPTGSLPLAGSQTLDNQIVQLGAYNVTAIQYSFYFPKAGKFAHYPATVAEEETLVARGPEKTFRVVAEPSGPDELSWEEVARAGNPSTIRDFLKDANLRSIRWNLIAHRMSDQDIYRTVTDILAEARIHEPTLWGYSLKHRDADGMKTFLSFREDLVENVGPVFQSRLLVVDPIDRRRHELLEYAPLVRARIHRLGSEHEILNDTFLKQYRDFVSILGHSDSVSSDQQLVLVHYLIVQNRIDEALQRFQTIDVDSLTVRLQYDYMDAYLAMHQTDYERAEKIASKYVSHPIPRWNVRFSELQTQLAQRFTGSSSVAVSGDEDSGESAGGPESTSPDAGDLALIDRNRIQSNAAQQQPSVVVRMDGETVLIDHDQTERAQLNVYGVDLELLFSKAPFVREDLQRMAMVRPVHRQPLSFDSPSGRARTKLPDELRRRTLLVEVVSGAARSTTLAYGGEMSTYVSESFGQLQARDAKTRQPVVGAYVKVYGKYPDGEVRFYKDGYTDLRGRFDYASLSAEDAQGAKRFAILVLSEDKGATLHDVASPTE